MPIIQFIFSLAKILLQYENKFVMNIYLLCQNREKNLGKWLEISYFTAPRSKSNNIFTDDLAIW